MREALAGLTVRGRAFLAAGVTAIVCAIVLGQPQLTRVGVLVAALPLLAAVLIGRSRYRLSLVRTVSPSLILLARAKPMTRSLGSSLIAVTPLAAPETMLASVTGKISLHRGKPQIEVTKGDQVKRLEQAAPKP